MNDSWADVRERIKIEDLGLPVTALVEMRHLLADADALLRYYRAHRAVEEGAVTFTLQNEQVLELRAAYTALPEHLRGESDERQTE